MIISTFATPDIMGLIVFVLEATLLLLGSRRRHWIDSEDREATLRGAVYLGTDV